MKLYRKMFSDTEAKPVVGDGRNALGVRPFDPNKPKKPHDVKAVNPTDLVSPGTGLSAYDDSGQIPAVVQGEMWVIETDDLPQQLVVHQRGSNPRHFHIEPANGMELGEFQDLLADTRDLWERADEEEKP